MDECHRNAGTQPLLALVSAKARSLYQLLSQCGSLQGINVWKDTGLELHFDTPWSKITPPLMTPELFMEWSLKQTQEKDKDLGKLVEAIDRAIDWAAALKSRVQRERTLLSRLFFGFKQSALGLLCIFLLCVLFHVRWAAEGSLGFHTMSGTEAVTSHSAPPVCLMSFRVLLAIVATCVPPHAMLSAQRDANMAGHSLPLGGFEVAVTFTMWSWIFMALYALQVAAATAAHQLLGLVPPPSYAAVLWVWFEVIYALSWLVTLAVWLAIIPVAHLSGHDMAVKQLLSRPVLFYHNANILLMQLELFLSSWVVQREHVIFALYFGMVYVIFNWWLHSRTGWWIYFFLDYDKAGVPSICILVGCVYVFFLFGIFSAGLIGKA